MIEFKVACYRSSVLLAAPVRSAESSSDRVTHSFR
jgi:hypothetical protein